MGSIRLVIFASLALVGLSAPVEEYGLSFVTFVHRHGDRSPVGTYPTDPYGNESLWNNGWGELTNAGKQNAYSLGKWLRARYADFLPKIYNKKDYEVQSTDVSRTLMSAYLVLAGLYEPTGSDVWSPDLKWQPIPVHTTPAALDNVLAQGKPCLRHSLLLVQLMASKEMSDRLESMAPTLSDIMKNAGFDSTNPVGNLLMASTVIDPLYVQGLSGFQLPKWAVPYFPKVLQDMTAFLLSLPTYNRPLQRLYCGLLVQDILQHFKLKSIGLLKKKMWQYSGHDMTIISLRQCLNLNETDAPPYASALILELRSKLGEYYVRILYKSGENLKTLVIPGCFENCPLKKFEELMKPIIPTNWEEECKSLKGLESV